MRNTRDALLGTLALTSVCGLAVPIQAAELYIPRAHEAVARRPFTFIYGASYLDNYYAKRSLVSPYGFSFGSYYPPYYYRYGYRYDEIFLPR
jgi:hypothetical protein